MTGCGKKKNGKELGSRFPNQGTEYYPVDVKRALNLDTAQQDTTFGDFFMGHWNVFLGHPILSSGYTNGKRHENHSRTRLTVLMK